jgi:CO/xanthine dehydrogenase Mo-binding subunit
MLEDEASSGPGDERKNYAFCSSAAHYCIVKLYVKTGKVKMHRMVCVADDGKIVNEKAAANQLIGASGKRLRDLPITPDKIIMALMKKEKGKRKSSFALGG